MTDTMRRQPTLTETVAKRIERDIIGGNLRPDRRLVLTKLAESYDIGVTPIREGLSRLVAQGLVIAEGNRGFRVAPLSFEDLQDITRLRCLVEVEALRYSIRNGDIEWEGRIASALHRMIAFINRSGDAFRESTPEFEAIHRGFHVSLISACESPRLLSLQSSLYDQADRYRRIMMSRHRGKDAFVEGHKELAAVAISRDVETAERLLISHLHQTLDYVYPENRGSDWPLHASATRP